MNNVKSKFIALFVLLILMISFSVAENHTVSTTVEVTQTAINRYLNTQYNTAGFPKDISVSVGGSDYHILLTQPEIILEPSNIKLRLVFNVKEHSDTVYHFSIQPSINIPSNQISASSIQAFLTNLQSIA